MHFLYDAAKDASNQEKHGIGFFGGADFGTTAGLSKWQPRNAENGGAWSSRKWTGSAGQPSSPIGE